MSMVSIKNLNPMNRYFLKFWYIVLLYMIKNKIPLILMKQVFNVIKNVVSAL